MAFEYGEIACHRGSDYKLLGKHFKCAHHLFLLTFAYCLASYVVQAGENTEVDFYEMSHSRVTWSSVCSLRPVQQGMPAFRHAGRILKWGY